MADLSPIGGLILMQIIGFWRLLKLIKAVRPRIGAWIVFAWLWR